MPVQRLLALALCLAAASAIAQPAIVLHVAVTGSDTTGDGSSATPWATITHALDNAPDGATILVGPGTYTGRVRLRGTFAQGVTVRAEPPYQAQLRHDATVVTVYDGQGIALEGFDIAHSGPGAGALVVQVQDLIGEPGGADRVSRITFRNNIIHDSFNNDLLKINNGATQVTVEGNVFYNQAGSDEHIDINSVTGVVVQDNIFFNDFAGSGRTNGNSTSSFIVVKDSNGNDDGLLGSAAITIRRNIFLNWEGSTGSNFLLIGEDGNPYYEAHNVWVENNLFLGNAPNVMRAAFGVKGCRDVYFINNTVSGDLPSLAYAMRLNTEGDNLPNDNIVLANTIWADPTGTMGAENPDRPNDFSDTPPTETTAFILTHNLYWNGGADLPEDPAELINPSDDPEGLTGDPGLADPSQVAPPRWQPGTQTFAPNHATIRDAFTALATAYGIPNAGSPAIGTANPDLAPADDLLGRPRSGLPSRGALELAVPGDADVNGDGLTDAVDIQFVVNATLGIPVPFDTDLDNDGSTNAVDIQRVVNAVLGA